MSLVAGDQLGPYRVEAPLGAGGMGEVFLARDTRLGREVAVKVLPPLLASSPERRARFEREARAISALSHPHVCALYDVGRAERPDGAIDYLVMERIEGESLAERLVRKPLPVAEVLALGTQLAGALAAAHRRGIVHRDLKPGNVMLTRSGAKLVDFGLAQLAAEGPDPPHAKEPATSLTTAEAHAPLTREGMLVGTWPYLAPERLRGHPADARGDIFALGCLLFEALSGRRAFPGRTQTEVESAILGDERPDLHALAPTVPPALATLVGQCLSKDPDGRWQSADDVLLGLQLVGVSLARPASARAESRLSGWALAAGTAALALAAAAAGFLLARRPPALELVRFSVAPPPGVTLQRPTAATTLAISPDGRHIAFVSSAEGVTSLWLWSAGSGLVRPLEDTLGGVGPFFSPDGREVAFFVGADLRRVPVAGGPAVTIARATLGSSGSWGDDGTILFLRPFGADAGIYAVPAQEGEPRALLRGDGPISPWAFPRVVAGSRRFLVLGGWGEPVAERRLCVASLDGGEPDCFMSCQSQGEYSGDGQLLCVRSGTLVAAPFDARTGRPTGEPRTVAKDVRWFGPSGAAAFTASADGRTLVYEPKPAPSRLVWFDRSGREVGTLGEPGGYGRLQLAPDGRSVAVDIMHPDGSGRDIWSLDTRSGVATRLTFARIDAWGPVWAPDASRLVHASSEDGSPDLALLRLDGSGHEDWLVRAPGIQIPTHWSSDGRLVAYENHVTGGTGERHAWLTTLEGEARRLSSAPFGSYNPRFAPDGRTVAYVSEESGRPEIYLADLAGHTPPRRISRAGGVLPRFSGDGRELFYLQPDGTMMAAAPANPAAAPRSLFHFGGVITIDFDYDVTPDGQRFLLRYATEAEGTAGLRVVTDWSQDRD